MIEEDILGAFYGRSTVKECTGEKVHGMRVFAREKYLEEQSTFLEAYYDLEIFLDLGKLKPVHSGISFVMFNIADTHTT